MYLTITVRNSGMVLRYADVEKCLKSCMQDSSSAHALNSNADRKIKMTRPLRTIVAGGILLACIAGCGGSSDNRVNPSSNVVNPIPIAHPLSRQRQPGNRFEGEGPEGGLSPAEVISHYRIAGSGKGQTIAIVVAGDDGAVESDLAVFSKKFDLPACTTVNGCFEKIFVDGKQPENLGWSTETMLDVEWAHAVAPLARIVLVEASSAHHDDLQAAVDIAAHKASVVSISWGEPEYPREAAVDQLFNVQQVTFVAAAGDISDVRLYPAASPNVIAVGGTSWRKSAAGQIVETAWKNTGGGPSVFEPMPASQLTFGVPRNGARRAIPDVGYNADPQSGYSVYDSSSGGWIVVGGTSAGAAQWAGIIAIANAQRAAVGKPALSSGTGSGAGLYIAALQGRSAASIDGAGFTAIPRGSDSPCGYDCDATYGFNDFTGLGVPNAPALFASLLAQ